MKRHTIQFVIVLCAVVVGLAAINIACFGDCPPIDLIKSGTYTAPEGVVAEQHMPTVISPHKNTEEKTMVVDRANETVTISYVRDGRDIVEVWRMAPF